MKKIRGLGGEWVGLDWDRMWGWATFLNFDKLYFLHGCRHVSVMFSLVHVSVLR